MLPNDALKGNAGCLVIHKGLVLAVQMKESSKWTLPSGKPIGTETAQETAMRETFEETGLRVAVGKLLHIFYDSRPFYLFEGTLLDESFVPEVPLESKDEIKKASFIDFKKIPTNEFRFPEALTIIQQLIDEMLDKPT
jgi:8-oxo-dGTP diphosphatase